MIDLITVVFQPEIPYLEIQARSIENNFAQDQIRTIYIVVNDVDSVADSVDRAWYGKFADRVVVYPYSIFGYVNQVGGWDNQQLCKILAAARSQCEWSLVLDAKTYFVRPCKPDLLVDSSNRACTNLLQIQPVFESARQTVEQLYQIKLDNIIGPGGVPFLFHTETVQAMIADTEQLTGKSFIEFFQSNVCYPNLITEFYLYSGYVKYKYGNFDSLYNQKQRWTCINVADWQVEQFDLLLQDMQRFLTLTVSVAGKAWRLLNTEQQQAYLAVLHKKHLIDDIEITQKKLNTVIN
jgi:hypothetical protein